MCSPELTRGMCAICCGSLTDESTYVDRFDNKWDVHKGVCAILAGEVPYVHAAKYSQLMTRIRDAEPNSLKHRMATKMFYKWVTLWVLETTIPTMIRVSDNLPEQVEWIDAEIVDEPPVPKPVCWWRCGPGIHRQRTAGDWGVQVRIDEQLGELWMRDVKTKYEVRVDAESWKVNFGGGDSLVHIDLLAFRPPSLPQAIDWQRITRWNDRQHPGDNTSRWVWDFDGPEAFY